MRFNIELRRCLDLEPSVKLWLQVLTAALTSSSCLAHSYRLFIIQKNMVGIEMYSLVDFLQSPTVKHVNRPAPLFFFSLRHPTNEDTFNTPRRTSS